jgi:hypothetical protein
LKFNEIYQQIIETEKDSNDSDTEFLKKYIFITNNNEKLVMDKLSGYISMYKAKQQEDLKNQINSMSLLMNSTQYGNEDDDN